MAEDQHVFENSPEKKEKRKWKSSVLENFSKLCHTQDKIRMKACVELLRYLTTHDIAEEADTESKYALGRLIRGLASSQNQTRTGYFPVLVALININNVTIEEVFQCIDKELQKGRGNSKSENADVCCGQIMTAGAVMRSNLYQNLSDTDKNRVLELLTNAAKERTYLTLLAYLFITDLYGRVNKDEFTRIILPAIKPEIGKTWLDQNVDSLYLLLETWLKFPNVIKTKFLVSKLGTPAIISRDSLPQLCNTLMTIPSVKATNHPVFDLVVSQISTSDLIAIFEELDNTLVKSSRTKYFVVTELLNKVLVNLEDLAIIPDLLNKNYIQLTITKFKASVGQSKDKEFQQIIEKLFETLLTVLKKDGVESRTKIQLLRKLLFYPGTFNFEKVTRTKLIQNITSTLNNEGVKKLAEIYCEVVLATKDKVDESTTKTWWNSDRIYASHLLVKLLSHPAVNGENEWKVEQLKFFMRLGLFKDYNVGNELADSLRNTFYSSLNLKLSKLEDLRFILSRVVDDLDASLQANSQKNELRQPLASEHYETWKRTVELASQLAGKKKRKKQVFHTLFLHLGLQLFNNVKLASDSLNELFSCYEQSSKKEEAGTNPEDPLWIEVVVDLFLNLLSHSSHLLRNVINWVFPHLCKYMNASAIHQVLSVLDPNQESNPLSRRDDIDDDEEDSGDNDGPENNDGSDEESDEDNSDAEDEAMEKEKVNDKLRMALHQALKVNEESDAESMDLDEMDDSEGEKLNLALGQAFKQFKPNLGRKKKQDKDDQALTHFRVRVLDLVEIYLNSNPPMSLALDVILPLLQTLEFSIRDDHQKPLQDRVRSCLKKLCSLKKFDNLEEVTERNLSDLLQDLLQKGTKNAIMVQEMGEKIADCCIFVIHCSQIIKSSGEIRKKKKDKLANVIKDSLQLHFEKRDCLIPYVLFKNVMQMNWDSILALAPILMEFVHAGDVRPFRRSQAVELLNIFYNNNRFIASHRDNFGTIKDVESKFLNDSIIFFNDFCSNPLERKVREKFMCNLFGLLASIKSSSPSAVDFDNWQELGDVVRECRTHISFSTDAKVAFHKLCKSLNVSHLVTMKSATIKLARLNEDVDYDEDKKETTNDDTKKNVVKKHKGQRKELLKQKKEAKELRLQSLSEGLESIQKRKLPFENGDVSKRKKPRTS